MFVVSYDIMGLRKVSMEVALDMFFPRHANMGLPRRKFAKT
jgi:hypothetical protein